MWSPIHDIDHEGTKISIAFSPCPNDTFMMDALIHGKISNPFLFEPHLLDIQELNDAAKNHLFDVTKISAAHLPLIADQYELLDAGSAMGFGVGPILVSKKEMQLQDISESMVGIPGKNTTANQLFHHFYRPLKTKFILFSNIENAILNDEIDAGVLIHEGRFTYLSKGLRLLEDLGTKWENSYQLPIPLGVFVVRKSMPEKLKYKINSLIHQSIQFAFDHPDDSTDYVRAHAQEMSKEVVDQHIKLYVNKYSLDMGDEGKKALFFLLKKLY
ncbi:MAG: 1,4-dihydroxy-6-naphthoate synthase [Saprospiraceae bacterium]|nr:1,4-dihydroxy-6-naphthoate synthase [Saprospiraceae bacterium]